MNRNQVIGGILGVVIGDALGLPVQFESRDKRRRCPVQGMEGWGAFNMPPGSISDDGSLTLCLAESICEAGLNPQDAADRFLRWYQRGHWTPLGYAYDIGRTTARAMERLKGGMTAVEAGPSGESDNGNGSLMRILPAALYLANTNLQYLTRGIWDISRITHGHPRACSACFIYALLVRELLTGVSPDEAYQNLCSLPEDVLRSGIADSERPHFKRVLNGKLAYLHEDEISSSGYVVDTLEAAIWCLLQTNDFRSTLLAAVNLGEDTDTVAAVTGGLAGIVYGLEGIPDEWIQALVKGDEITELANRFADVVCEGQPATKEGAKHSYCSFDRMYWVDSGRLLAGGYPGDLNPERAAEKLGFLVKSGIRQVINLMEPDEVDHYGNSFIPYEEQLRNLAAEAGTDIQVSRYPVRDMTAPTVAQMKEILDAIDKAIEEDRPVYVHCWGGHGRTGTVSGCYLIRHGIVNANEVLEYIISLRKDTVTAKRRSPETVDQVKLVTGWALGL